jgi:hypothetical protein
MAIGTCSKCENNFKRRIRYSKVKQNLQKDITPPAPIIPSRLTSPSNNMLGSMEKKPCNQCSELFYFFALNEGVCFKCFSENKQSEWNKELEKFKRKLKGEDE